MPPLLRRWVVRWGTPQYSVGTVCAIVRTAPEPGRSTVLVLRQHHRRGWTLPGGLVDSGEDSDAAIRRELTEEIGADGLDPGFPVTTLVDPRARRVDIIYRIEAGEDFSPRPRGEAWQASWLRPDELDGDSGETVRIVQRLMQSQGGRL